MERSAPRQPRACGTCGRAPCADDDDGMLCSVGTWDHWQPPCTRADCEYHWSRDPPGQVHCEHEYGSPFCKYRPKQGQPLICANVGHEHCEDCQGMDADCEDYLPQQPREGGGDRE